jgi:predicted Zn-dependent protease
MTGRKQLLLVPESQEIGMGQTAFDEIQQKEHPSTNAAWSAMVERVGQRIASAADRPDYAWEFRLIQGDTQNAFCLPGGKVVVYEGILPVCESEGGLAVVMAHEVAHAIARHGGERMSQNYAVGAVQQAVSYATQSQTEVRRALFMRAYGLGTQYGVLLPYSREHELEADRIGIMLMAKAGYDPREAPSFWRRFAHVGSGQAPIEFLSTHPSDQRRAVTLQELVPAAEAIYGQAPERYGRGEMIAPQALDPAAPTSAGTSDTVPTIPLPAAPPPMTSALRG